MKDQDITLTLEERRQIVATRNLLARLREDQNFPLPVTAALVGLEMVLACGCPRRDTSCISYEMPCTAGK